MPDPNPERARLSSYTEWLDIRQKISPPLPDNSIYLLPYMDAEKSTKLIKEGITTVDEITDVTVLKQSTQKYLAARTEGRRVVETEKLDEFLSQISFPVYYLDYEASQSFCLHGMELARIKNVPFQYSLQSLRVLMEKQSIAILSNASNHQCPISLKALNRILVMRDRYWSGTGHLKKREIKS